MDRVVGPGESAGLLGSHLLRLPSSRAAGSAVVVRRVDVVLVPRTGAILALATLLSRCVRSWPSVARSCRKLLTGNALRARTVADHTSPDGTVQEGASEGASSSKGQSVTSVRGAGVKGASPAERGRSVAEPLDAGEHTLTLVGPTMPVERVAEPMPGYRMRPVPRNEDAAKALKQRTPTNLRNVRPQSPMHTTPLTPPWLLPTVGR